MALQRRASSSSSSSRSSPSSAAIIRSSLAPYVCCPEQAVESVVDFLDLRSREVLLEIGCGDARILQRAAALCRDSTCIGIDMDREAIEAATLRLTERSRRLNGPPPPRNVHLIHADVMQADDKIPWDRVDKIVMHLTTTAHHKIWAFLQDRVRRGVKVYTLQFPVPEVKALVEKEMRYTPTRVGLEKGSFTVYSYIYPSEDRSVRMQMEAWTLTTAQCGRRGGESTVLNVDRASASGKLEVAYSVHGGPARRTDFIGLYRARGRGSEEAMMMMVTGRASLRDSATSAS